jgi:hypothetical protein
LLTVLLDLLFGELRDVNRYIFIELAYSGSIGVLNPVDYFLFLLECLFGRWEDNHLCSIGQGDD